VTLRDQLQETLGDAYTVEEELGGGGMSTVCLAHDRALDRKVVIKVLPRHFAAGVNVERFKREILLAAGLQHPHIVGVLSAGDVGGLPYFIMPYVEGDSLRARLASGPLPIRETVDLMKDVAKALAYAHEREIVHRDVKPDNVLLSGGAAMLSDFGVAKALRNARQRDEGGASLTESGTSLGTPAYMAPEQAAGQDDVDHRADLYAFGITAYEMLAGKPPFHDRSFTKIIAAHITEPPPPIDRSDVPSGLADLVMRCLAKDPADRPQSAREILQWLDRPDVFSGEGWAVGALPRRSMMRTVAMSAAVLLAALAGFWFARGESDLGADAARSIAVLPLVNVSGDTADSYFADGVTEEITSALQRVPGVRVASRTATFAFKDKHASVEEIGSALHVATLLEGTVRRAGDRLRVTAQLVSVDDGLAMWSQTFETDMRDVFAVQDSIAHAIVLALQSKFGGVAGADVDMRPGTDDLEAYDLYLRGRFLFAQRGEDALRRAASFFERSVQRDPTFAEAYTGLADALGLLPLYSTTPSDSVLPLALAAVDRAITLDSGLAVAHASRGNLLAAGWRWTDAERDFRRAIALDSSYATAHQWLGELLIVLGEQEDAVAELRRATELDPLSPVMAGSYGNALAYTGRYDEAIASGRRAVELGPSVVTYMMLGSQLLYARRIEQAIRALDTSVSLAGAIPAPAGLLGYTLALAGRADSARAVLAPLLAGSNAPNYAAAIARVYLGLGQTDSALHWLTVGAERHDPFFHAEGLATPMFDPLRPDPRFVRLVDLLGLDPARLVRP